MLFCVPSRRSGKPDSWKHGSSLQAPLSAIAHTTLHWPRLGTCLSLLTCHSRQIFLDKDEEQDCGSKECLFRSTTSRASKYPQKTVLILSQSPRQCLQCFSRLACSPCCIHPNPQPLTHPPWVLRHWVHFVIVCHKQL